MTTPTSADTLDPRERTARRRVARRMGWLIHAAVFVAVNAFLWLRALGTDGHAPVVMLSGWAFALCIHGVVVLASDWGRAVHGRMLDAERRRMGLERDPW